MLKLNESFVHQPVLSLRVGRQIATATAPIINPNNLFIEGWHVVDSENGDKLILLTKDIREVMDRGIVIDDHEVLSEPKDLIRLKDLLKLDFKLIGLSVTSENKHNYGKVNDFAFEIESFYIKKLYAGKPVMRSLSGGNLSIDRTQIVEITNRRVIIEDPTVQSDDRAPAPVVVS